VVNGVPPGNAFSGVSCTSASACTAVGSFGGRNGGQFKTLVESWDGTRWSVVPSPNEGPASGSNELWGVSCRSASACTAVGNIITNGNHYKTLVESWDGTRWSVVPSPNEGPVSDDNQLYGVSCPSASACTAVGGIAGRNGGQFKTLIESWDGTRWSVVPSPNGPNEESHIYHLYNVSCPSASACTAVGTFGHLKGTKGSDYQTFVESWDGTRWSVVPSPNGPNEGEPNYDQLWDVSCPSASACTAVGSFGYSSDETLVESWNGARWSVVPSPDVGLAFDHNDLLGVSCTSASLCTAVGSFAPNYVFTTTGDMTLVESWDGAKGPSVET
jgi:hypothetical protein